MLRQLINRLIDFCCCWARDQSREEKFRELAIKEYNELWSIIGNIIGCKIDSVVVIELIPQI